MFIIGIDPHKGSHTAVAVDRSESVLIRCGGGAVEWP